MAVLILSRAEVESLLDPDELVDALAEAMVDLSSGRASMPPRVAALVAEHEGLLGVMPAWLPSAGMLEAKLVSLFPGNAGTAVPTHQAVIVAFDPRTGTPAALLDGTGITAIRTAAGSALATRVLAREDASVLAILGTGVQAGAHAVAVSRVRPFHEIRVAGRNPELASVLEADLGGRLGMPVAAAPSFEEAARGADVVSDIAEIGEVLSGTRPGRESPDQLTLYKSVGVAVQDAAAAALVLRAARERGLGTDIDI